MTQTLYAIDWLWSGTASLCLPMAAWDGSCITLPLVELKISTLLVIEMVCSRALVKWDLNDY